MSAAIYFVAAKHLWPVHEIMVGTLPMEPYRLRTFHTVLTRLETVTLFLKISAFQIHIIIERWVRQIVAEEFMKWRFSSILTFCLRRWHSVQDLKVRCLFR